MIVFLHGQVVEQGDGFVDLDVRDVGYRVYVTEDVVRQLPEGSATRLYTYHHVREDATLLYGFIRQADRAMFEKLLGVSGIGPRLALQMLGGTSAESLAGAISREDANTLCALPGIGKKTAQRIILDLKDKLADLPLAWDSVVKTDLHRPRRNLVAQDVTEALIGLGYRPKEAEAAVATVLQQDANVTVEAAVKAALSWLYAHQSEVNA